jgi:multiple sugar transport system substrate-binding protein
VNRTFLVCLLVLTAASALLHWSLPENRSPVPVLYWATQDDPVKRETVVLFGQWLRDRGLPPIDLRIDHSNQDTMKKLVQGVSGVGDDLLDLYFSELEVIQATGMLADLTDDARRDGYDPGQTYAAALSDITVRGRQYGFPRNVDITMCWVNRDTFARYGQPEPPLRWGWDEFEERGRRFVAAANPPGARQRVYYINRVWPYVLRRGLGLSTFNETMTRCTLDDPRNAEVLKRICRWTVELRLMPTEDEQRAIAADATGYDSSFALFATGRFGMIYEGLWALIRLRPRGDFRLGAVEPFTGGFPNTELGSGAIGVYKASRHPELARRFLQFLASEPFSLLVARSGDSLPPLPACAETGAYLRPPDYPNDWGVKATFAKAGREIGIAQSKSPFVLPIVAFRIDTEAIQAVMAGRLTPEAAARRAAERINAEIALTARQDAALGRLFAEREVLQQRIDARRAAGRPVPAAWISDPFHLAYYRAQGWLEKEEGK